MGQLEWNPIFFSPWFLFIEDFCLEDAHVDQFQLARFSDTAPRRIRIAAFATSPVLLPPPTFLSLGGIPIGGFLILITPRNIGDVRIDTGIRLYL